MGQNQPLGGHKSSSASNLLSNYAPASLPIELGHVGGNNSMMMAARYIPH